MAAIKYHLCILSMISDHICQNGEKLMTPPKIFGDDEVEQEVEPKKVQIFGEEEVEPPKVKAFGDDNVEPPKVEVK